MSNQDNLPVAIMLYIIESSPDADNAASLAAEFVMAVCRVQVQHSDYTTAELMRVAAKRCSIDLDAALQLGPAQQLNLWNLSE